MNSLNQMIEHTSINNYPLMQKLAEPLQRYFGIHYFCYQFVSNEGLWYTIGNNPDWLIHSAKHQFYRVDPTLVHPKHYQHSTVCLPKQHEHQPFQQTLIEHAVNLFDLDHSLAVIQPSDSGCEFYFFCAPSKHQNVLYTYLTQLPRLQQDYPRYLKTYLKPLHDHFLNWAVSLTELNSDHFNAYQHIFSTENTTLKESEFLQAIHDYPNLTHREYECLKLYQQGLTAKQSARLLGLSHRTIEGIFENIKFKCRVTHKRDLLLMFS